MPNPVVRWQIIAPNPDATTKFYQQLFGWSVSQQNALGYREVSAGGGGIDGGVWPGPPTMPHPFVQLYIEVVDVDNTIADAVRMGAKVIVPRSVLPDGDAMAVLHDPSGLSFAVCTAKT